MLTFFIKLPKKTEQPSGEQLNSAKREVVAKATELLDCYLTPQGADRAQCGIAVLANIKQFNNAALAIVEQRVNVDFSGLSDGAKSKRVSEELYRAVVALKKESVYKDLEDKVEDCLNSLAIKIHRPEAPVLSRLAC